MSSPNTLNAISVFDIAPVLRRRRLQILATFILVTAGVVAGTLAMPKQYEAHMKVLVKNERPQMVITPDRNDRADYRGEISEAEINSEIELLTSNNLLQQVVTTSGLDRRQPAPDASSAVERAVKRLERNLKVTPVRKSNVILVQYTDTDPRQAVAVLARLSDFYLEQHLKVHGSPGTYEFFKGEAQRYQKELQEAEARLADFRSREDVIMPSQQKDVALQKAAETESSLMQADTAISEYTRRIADTRRQLEATPARVVTQSRTSSNQYSVERLHTMLAELKNRRTQLLSKFRPEDRMVQEADQEIADTQQALEKAQKLMGLDEATDVNPVYQSLQLELVKQQTELAGAESRRRTLAQQSSIYHQQLAKFATASAAYDDLLRTQKEAEENYLIYSKKTEEARITQSLDLQKIANVAIAESPVQPHLPSKPNVWLNIGLGVILAGMLSLGLPFAWEYVTRPGLASPEARIEVPVRLGAGSAQRLLGPVESSADLEDLTGLPILATTYRS
jgi:uncharacterized protein involved in exopolysaccharide biosynthesis